MEEKPESINTSNRLFWKKVSNYWKALMRMLGLRLDWRRVGEELTSRDRLMTHHTARYIKKRYVPELARNLATCDVFVEKALIILEKRARHLYVLGWVAAFSAAFILLGSAFLVYEKNIAELIGDLGQTAFVLTLIVMKLLTIGGFVVGVVVFMISLARAFLHEATSLQSRSHALRYGRLRFHVANGDLTDKTLDEVFSWNKEFRSSFLDIDPDRSSKSILAAMEKFTKQVTDLLTSIKVSRKKKKRERAKLD